MQHQFAKKEYRILGQLDKFFKNLVSSQNTFYVKALKELKKTKTNKTKYSNKIPKHLLHAPKNLNRNKT